LGGGVTIGNRSKEEYNKYNDPTLPGYVSDNTNTKRAVELNNIGVAHFNNGNFKEAIKYYSKSIDINPNDATVWLNLGNAYNALSMDVESTKCYAKAVLINPNNAIAWYCLGISFHKRHLYDLAIKSYDLSLAINPNDYTILKSKNLAIDELYRTKGGQGNNFPNHQTPKEPPYPTPSGGLMSKKVEVILNELGMSEIIDNI
jgi:tetratricopeptide (TPR) repeat protein